MTEQLNWTELCSLGRSDWSKAFKVCYCLTGLTGSEVDQGSKILGYAFLPDVHLPGSPGRHIKATAPSPTHALCPSLSYLHKPEHFTFPLFHISICSLFSTGGCQTSFIFYLWRPCLSYQNVTSQRVHFDLVFTSISEHFAPCIYIHMTTIWVPNICQLK